MTSHDDLDTLTMEKKSADTNEITAPPASGSEHIAKNILIVDDEADIRSLLSDILKDEGYKTAHVGGSEECYSLLKTLDLQNSAPDLVILDIWLQDSPEDGIDILKKLKARYPDIPVIMISGHGTIETAVESIKYGAYDFIEKPFKSDRLLLLIRRALETHALRQENKKLKREIDGPAELVGTSAKLTTIRQILDKAAPTNSRVLITGEPGTGKDIAARVLHQSSQRAGGPFMTLNCAVLRPDQMESELFGQAERSGILEKADGGTLFLDEVADMPLETQGKIIRAIQDQSFNRVGDSRQIDVDVRIVASTNRDLPTEIEQGNFRQDLYYRLNVVPLHIPPLRERRGDIPLLCTHFIGQYSKATGMQPKKLSRAALAVMEGYDWPGNVRQLKNAMEWVMIMISTPADQDIRPDQLPPEITGIESDKKNTGGNQDFSHLPLREAREQFEKEYLRTQLHRFEGNISKTAAFVGMERSALHRKMKSLDLGRKTGS